MNTSNGNLKHEEMTQKIIKVFFEVYNELGQGFLESVYENAMCIALRSAGLTVDRQVPIPVWFRGQKVGDFKADLLVNGIVLLELKTVQAIDRSHESQLLNYLRATSVEVGLILNFGPSAKMRRFILDNDKKTYMTKSCAAEAP